MRTLTALFILAVSVWGIDYSQRSTQELIASLHPGGKNIDIIIRELKKREATMSPAEKRVYRMKIEEIRNVEKK